MKGLIPNPETKVVPHGTCPNCGDTGMMPHSGTIWEECDNCHFQFKAHWIIQFVGYSQKADALNRRFLTETHQETDAKRESMNAYYACKAVVTNWEKGDLAKADRMCQAVVDVVRDPEGTTHE